MKSAGNIHCKFLYTSKFLKLRYVNIIHLITFVQFVNSRTKNFWNLFVRWNAVPCTILCRFTIVKLSCISYIRISVACCWTDSPNALECAQWHNLFCKLVIRKKYIFFLGEEIVSLRGKKSFYFGRRNLFISEEEIFLFWEKKSIYFGRRNSEWRTKSKKKWKWRMMKWMEE